ncbi:hypothetical protein H5410_047560 [Solanum commersonii]|uniref:RNase H type-1 domain-containing protein n=1 Tax=Solanum commersonii TaxID=4109 RepID=A0A9J5XJ10_SOLCO|nr:hypothetical protein H5410_047560 [Solanum commersonii]
MQYRQGDKRKSRCKLNRHCGERCGRRLVISKGKRNRQSNKHGNRISCFAGSSSLLSRGRFKRGYNRNRLTMPQKMVEREWKVSWDLVERIEEIGKAIQSINASITHTFREGNFMADSLVNEVVESQETKYY